MAYLLRFAVVCVVFQSISANAAVWKFQTSSVNGTDVYVDTESWRELPPVQIKRPFSVRQIWVKYDHSKDKTETARSKVELLRFNCTAETSALASLVSYRADGTVIKSKTWDDYDFNYEPVVPDTIGYAIMQFACGR